MHAFATCADPAAPSSGHVTVDLPRSTALAPNPRAARFLDTLERARTTGPVDSTLPLPGSMVELMRLLLLVETLGAPAPEWMIDALRAAGLESLADTLVIRNERLEQEGLQAHA